MIWAGYLNDRELSWLRSQGAVGHMAAQFYDIKGRFMDVEVNQRSVGIGIKTLLGKDPSSRLQAARSRRRRSLVHSAGAT